MHFTTLASAAALVASASAFASNPNVFNYNASCNTNEPKARVVNRCPKPVYLWSVLKGQGCPDSDAVVLQPGEFYQENYRDPDGGAGVSIKIAYEPQCKGIDITQLEYFINGAGEYAGNYLDVSFVDCQGETCPGRDSYYLKSGNTNGLYTANAVNEICPILSCNSVEECSQCSYVLPDDRQTKFCNSQADLDFYMCGSEAPGEEPVYQQPSSAPEPSSTPSPTPSSSAEATSTPAAYQEVAAAAITPAPKPEAPKEPKVKTEIVFVTEIAYVNAKRHVHAHGRRHQQFHA